MKILFVHNNFPAQFRHIALHLSRSRDHSVAAIGSETALDLPGIRLQRYGMDLRHIGPTHPFARHFDMECRRAEQVLYAASSLASDGFKPDLIVVHSGWGENLPLRWVFPGARIIVYCEYYYRPNGQDVNFDPEFPILSLDGMTALGARNANGALALVEAEGGITPTFWQRSTYPTVLQEKIRVVHEGVNTQLIRPDPKAVFRLPSGRILRKGDPVLTFVARNLEPLRGYHVFMRALPRILSRCPKAEVLIVGGDQTSYGPSPPSGSWKEIFYEEQISKIDATRVHFLGVLDYSKYLDLLNVSAAHVYFTYPFVLSWSLVEAMSSGCTIIASDTAPVQEVLDENSSFLVPFLDSYVLAEVAIECLSSPDSQSTKGAAARRKAIAEFDIEKVSIPRFRELIIENWD